MIFMNFKFKVKLVKNKIIALKISIVLKLNLNNKKNFYSI